MNNTLYITNKTNKPIQATISDNYNDYSVLTCQLMPGANEITVKSLDSGTYIIRLTDEENGTFYQQKMVKD